MPEWITVAFSDIPLLGLFVFSFLASTLLPGGSEVALAAYIVNAPTALWLALGLATLGNTLGGGVSYLCGRILPRSEKLAKYRSVEHLERYGAPLLLLSWVPLIGDLFCVAAGWLRMNTVACVAFMAVGKFARYWVVAQGALLF